jgi:hypothetical protein
VAAYLGIVLAVIFARCYDRFGYFDRGEFWLYVGLAGGVLLALFGVTAWISRTAGTK